MFIYIKSILKSLFTLAFWLALIGVFVFKFLTVEMYKMFLMYKVG